MRGAGAQDPKVRGLEAKGITVRYGRRGVLDGLDLPPLRPGEVTVLAGPNAAGKSTLLRQLKTVLAPHGRRSGQILFDGKNLDEMPQREQAASHKVQWSFGT